jgi:hypothetical protein
MNREPKIRFILRVDALCCMHACIMPGVLTSWLLGIWRHNFRVRWRHDFANMVHHSTPHSYDAWRRTGMRRDGGMRVRLNTWSMCPYEGSQRRGQHLHPHQALAVCRPTTGEEACRGQRLWLVRHWSPRPVPRARVPVSKCVTFFSISKTLKNVEYLVNLVLNIVVIKI